MKPHRWLFALAAIGISIFSVLVLLGLPASAQSAKPGTGSDAPVSPDRDASASLPDNANTILYDQYDHPVSPTHSSQNFEPALDPYDDFLADDFIVPEGHLWRISQVDVQGEYFNGPGPADSMNIFIYSNAITTPGELVATRANLTFTHIDRDFSIPLTNPIELEPGNYWLSVQANQDFTPEGQWGWADRGITTTQSAAWQNPGGGFNICQSWGRRTDCLGDPAAGDQVFRLSGTRQPIAQPFMCAAGGPGGWSYRNFLPAPAYSPGVASDGVYVYAVGGYSTQAGVDFTQTVRYDPVTNLMTDLAPLPDARTGASAVYVPLNHKLYVFGGENRQMEQVYNTSYIYDIASNTWTTGAPMPGVRAFMGAGYADGKIYLAGGYTTTDINTAQAQTWEYNVLSNTWTTKADMPEPLGGPAAGILNGHLFVIGGRDGSLDARNQTYDYNIAQNSWSARMNAPYGVNVPGTAVLQNKIWVIGGGAPFLAYANASSSPEANAPDTFAATLFYDPVANTWANGPALSIPRSFVGAANAGNFTVAMGGYDGSAATDAVEVAWVCPELQFSPPAYQVSEGAGTAVITVTLAPTSPITATVHFSTSGGTASAGSDYIATTGTLTFPPGASNKIFSISIVNDTLFEPAETVGLKLDANTNAAILPPNPATLTILNDDLPPTLACGGPAPGAWSLRNYLPQAVYGPAVASDGLYAYVLGGYNKQGNIDLTQALRYDPLANNWIALPPLPDARTMASAVYSPINRKLYVFGGEKEATQQVFGTTYIFDLSSHTWSTGASLPNVRAMMGAGYADGKIYLVGGYTTSDVHSAQPQTWEYDVLSNTWQTRSDMPESLGGPAAGVVDGHLYVIGGRDGSTAARNQTYDYDIAQDAWSMRANAPSGVNVPGVAVLQGKIWVIGGGDPFLAQGASFFPASAHSPQTANTTMIYDPASNSWAYGHPLNLPRSFTGGVGFNNFLLAIGGYADGASLAAVEAAWLCPNNYLPTVIRDGP